MAELWGIGQYRLCATDTQSRCHLDSTEHIVHAEHKTSEIVSLRIVERTAHRETGRGQRPRPVAFSISVIQESWNTSVRVGVFGELYR